jgi:nicotinate phosphoribosyltransferase
MFAQAFPTRTTLLIDTYDTVAAAHKAVEVAKEMEARGERLAGVRLDSGDIVVLSKEVRRIFDAAGLDYVRIFVSGGLDEQIIDQFLEDGAPIDAFGVGTRMDVSADAPYMDMAYKLVRYEGRYVLKTSPGKETWTGEKQVYRLRDRESRFTGDLIALRDEPSPSKEAEPLLQTVMESGRIVKPHPPLPSIRDYCAAQVAALLGEVRRLKNPTTYPVRYSARLISLQRSLEKEVQTAEVAPALAPHPTSPHRGEEKR